MFMQMTTMKQLMTNADRNIAVVSTNKGKYSETFIHQQIESLEGKIYYLTGGYLPEVYSHGPKSLDNKFPSTKSLFSRLLSSQRISDSDDTPASKVSQFLVKENISCVLAHYGPSGVEMMDICKKQNIPLITHFHGYDAFRKDILGSYGIRYHELFTNSAAIISVSNNMTEQLLKIGCPPKKAICNPCGYNQDIFVNSRFKKDKNIFVSCGRFVEKKAPHLLIKSFKRTLKKITDARLVMIGDGEILEYCKELAEKLQLTNKIDFMGILSQQEIHKIYSQSLVYLQHSITTETNDSEGTPVSILEASASGLPVISTHHGGIPNIVQHNKTGYLCQEHDIESFSDFMVQICQDKELAHQMGTSGAEFVESRFTQTISHRHLNKIISDVIDNFTN
jgi:colanic acid/amylovoran biosynthesis glycosyltransferase